MMARSDTTSLLLLGGAAVVAYSLSRGGMPARGQRDPMPDAMYWETLWDPQGRIKGLIWKSAEGPIYELLFAGSLSMQEWSVYVGGGTKVGTFKTRKAAVDAARKHYYATTPGWGHGAGQRAGFGGGEHTSWEQQMYEKRMATPARKYIYRFKPGRHPGIEQDIGKAISYARSKGLVVEENVEESLRGGPWTRAGVFPVADFRAQGRSARGRRARGTPFTKQNLRTEGKWLFYLPVGGTYKDRKFVARFRTAGVGTFATHLRKNWTVEDYFAEYEAGKAPLTIVKQTGYLLPHIKKWLKQGGYPVTQAGFEQMSRDERTAREGSSARGRRAADPHSFADFKRAINNVRKSGGWYQWTGLVDGKNIRLKGYEKWLQIYQVDGVDYSTTMYIDTVREFNEALAEPFKKGSSARGRRAKWGKVPAFIEISPGRYSHQGHVTLYVKSPESGSPPQKAMERDIGGSGEEGDWPSKVAHEWATAYGKGPGLPLPVRDTRPRGLRGRRASRRGW